MRSQNRSDHRPPDPPEDWVDGSWTVDCVCGVNYDDGEEMVNCDECGVWVHTRCSCYVKSEKLFACDKCKSKKNKKYNDNDEEETEVAQLLIELPAKTLRRSMGDPNPPHGFRRRLWTEIPMEERVHVQGVPGGELGIFGGLTSVFGQELWKCTGYVPKKFNFQYKEFSCWDEENENPGNNNHADACVQLSLSKEEVGLPTESPSLSQAVLPTDSTSLGKFGLPTNSASLGGGTKRHVEESGTKRHVEETDTSKKKGDGENLDVRSTPQNGVKKKDKSSLHSNVFHYGKRKKEDTQTFKDQSRKKKARVVHIDGEDSKKRNVHASKSGDAKRLDFYEGRGLKTDKNVTQSGKHENSKGTFPDEPSSECFCLVSHKVDDSKNNLAFSGQTPDTLPNAVSKHSFSIKARPTDRNGELTARLQISPKVSDFIQSSLDHNDSGSFRSKEEVVGDAPLNVNDNGGYCYRSERIDISEPEPPVEDLEITASQVKDSQNDQDSNGDISVTSLLQNRAQVDILNPGRVVDVKTSPPCDVKLDGMEPPTQHPVDHLSENFKVKDDVVGSSQSIEHKVEDIDKSTVVADCQIDKADGASYERCQFKWQLESESSLKVRESSPEHKPVGPTEELSELGDKILNPLELPNQCKMVVSFGKSSSVTSTILISKSSPSDSRRETDGQNHDFDTKLKGMSEYKVSNKEDNSSADVVKDRDGHEKLKKLAKELPKSSIKFLHSSVSTRTLSESKESFSYAKPSFVQSSATIPGSGESASSLQTESALDVENKTAASGLLQRNVKANNLHCQPSTKVNHTPQMHHPAPLNSSATLSDEELALLLHQELNSSPRVPRVPRMRHAGSLPQLASPTATSMLTKRASSSSVGKDHGLVSKRKGMDLAKEGSHNSHELQEESKNVNRSPFLPLRRRNDLARTAGPVTKGEKDNRSVKGVQSVNKSIPCVASLTAGSGSLASSETNERNMSSTRNSPLNASDDDTDVIRPTHRTLPGLLSEIIKDRRMTYEELCDVVMPYWPNLRKHNGERYAYSSHSQAVLDCLRNRTEWARLVDRGPKTNAGRKRRRTDAEAPSFDSEENEGNKDRNAKDVESTSFESHHDHFPKGKRKARKCRRRLALQGRGIKDVRRGRRHREADDVVSYDNDIYLLSNSSSEESMFGEDEMIQGEEGGTCSAAGRREASAS